MCREGGGLGRSPGEASGVWGWVGVPCSASGNIHCLGGEQGEREGLSSFVENTNPSSGPLAAELVAGKPDQSTIKGTCGIALPAKGESLGKPGLPEGPL